MTAEPASRGRLWVLRAGTGAAGDVLTFRILPGSEKTVGRAKGVDFVVDAPLVSRVHCRVTAHPAGQLELEDLKSTNGTYVNDHRVDCATLRVGDRLRIGRVEFSVEEE